MTKEKPVSSTLYDSQYYVDKCRGFHQFEEGKIHPAIEYALNLVNPANSKILDVGCGRGELVYACAIRNNHVIGIDYADAAIQISKGLLQKLPIEITSRIELKQMDAKELSFPDNSFDYIFALDVVEHLHPWELDKAISEIYRVLKPNGKFVVHTSPNKIAMLPAYMILRLLGVRWGSQDFHVNEQTVWSFKKYLLNFQWAFQMFLTKDTRFWLHCIEHRNSKIFTNTAKIYDFLLDNHLSDYIIKNTFLIEIFGTDIWAIVEKPENRSTK